ncbi:MAG: hypothetical protein L0L75_07595, partial [Enterobacterales bacterium]|nr:hypothetical protein [Enterobacterales bacterium]
LNLLIIFRQSFEHDFDTARGNTMFRKTDKVERSIEEEVSLLADALEGVLQEGADKTEDEIASLRRSAQDTLREVKARISGDTPCPVTDRVKNACCDVNGYVRNKPWHSVGIGATAGLILGLLLSKR